MTLALKGRLLFSRLGLPGGRIARRAVASFVDSDPLW
jgi:hypothetical protein